MAILQTRANLFGMAPNAPHEHMREELRLHNDGYFIQGIVFIVLGLVAAVLPGMTALSAELFLGALFFISGIAQLILSFESRMHWWSMLSALLSIAVGIMMVWYPLSGLLTLVTVITVFLALEGIFEIFLALQFRPLRNWSWMLFSGFVALMLAALLWMGFPGLSILYVGWIIAANFIFYGMSLLMLVWDMGA